MINITRSFSAVDVVRHTKVNCSRLNCIPR